jgi:hypothetical protein
VNTWLNLSVRFVKAINEGVWLGLLSGDDLNALTAAYYRESPYYASKKHTVSGLFEWEKTALERYFPKDSHILIAAAGSGREILALRNAGFQADGFECSSRLLQAGRLIFDELGQTAYVAPCSPDEVPTGKAEYSGVIVGWSAYTHIPSRSRRVAFLRSLRQRAFPGSPILLSFFTVGSYSRYQSIVYRIGKIVSVFFRPPNELLSRGDRLTWNRYDHCFSREEVRAELEMAGFTVVEFNEDNNDGYAVGIAV